MLEGLSVRVALVRILFYFYDIHNSLHASSKYTGSVNVSAGSSSGMVGGLMTGEQYQFSVSITVPGNGRTYTGPVSDPSDPFTVIEPPSTGGEYNTKPLSFPYMQTHKVVNIYLSLTYCSI